MKSDVDSTQYRDHLLSRLQGEARRSASGASDVIHVFVNQRRVGSLIGAGRESTFQFHTESRIHDVHLRAEDGALLGGLSAPEFGVRSSRIRVAHDTIEIEVQNLAHGGVVNTLFLPAPGFWHKALRAWPRELSAAAPARPVAFGLKAVALAQVLLALTLAGLVADRWSSRRSEGRAPAAAAVTQTPAPQVTSLDEVAQLRHQLAELSRAQAQAVETMHSHQQSLVQFQRTIATLSASQEAGTSGMRPVKHELDQRGKGASGDADRIRHMLVTRALSEQEQLEAEIHSLLLANDRLSRERAQLEQRNLELHNRLKSTGTDVSQASTPDREKPVVAHQVEPTTPPQMADARPAPQQPPFLFWVTFSDGTSQDSIDQWVRDMHGRKGAVAEGWQAVEIVPPAEPMERFLDQIKQTKIVKAVKVSR